jgi:hypothetical protein
LVLPLLLVAAVARAIHVPGERRLPELARASDPDFGGVPPGPVPAIDDHFVASLLGDPLYKRIVGAVPGARLSPAQTAVSGSAASRAEATGPAVRPGGATALFAPGMWDLRLTFTPDRTAVASGERFTYLIKVTNVGTDRFAGLLRLDWHVPLHTRSTAACVVEVAPLPCPLIGPLFLEPGTGVDGALGLHLNFLRDNVTIPPGGAYTHALEVEVNSVVPPDTVLVNHAHLGVGGGGTGRVTANAAPVTVELRTP